MSFWEESIDLLKAKGDPPRRVAPRRGKHSVPKGAKTFTPKKGWHAGTEFKVVQPPEGKDTGFPVSRSRRIGFDPPSKAKLGYVRRSPRTVKDKTKKLAEEVGTPTVGVRKEQVKTQWEKDRPGFFSSFKNLGDWTGKTYGSHNRPIPKLADQSKFRANVKKDLERRQSAFATRVPALLKQFGASDELSPKAKLVKKKLESLSPRRRKEILDMYSGKRLASLMQKEPPPIGGLHTRFSDSKGPYSYRGFGGFYFNPHVMEVAVKEKSRGMKAALGAIGATSRALGRKIFKPEEPEGTIFE